MSWILLKQYYTALTCNKYYVIVTLTVFLRRSSVYVYAVFTWNQQQRAYILSILSSKVEPVIKEKSNKKKNVIYFLFFFLFSNIHIKRGTFTYTYLFIYLWYGFLIRHRPRPREHYSFPVGRVADLDRLTVVAGLEAGDLLLLDSVVGLGTETFEDPLVRKFATYVPEENVMRNRYTMEFIRRK